MAIQSWYEVMLKSFFVQQILRHYALTINGATTLPDANSNSGRVYIIKKIDNSSNTVAIVPQSGQTIDGQSNKILTAQNEVVRIVASGLNWYII